MKIKRLYILMSVLILSFYTQAAESSDITFPVRTPPDKDIDISFYPAVKNKRLMKFLKTPQGRIWFVTRQDNFLYAYQCELLSMALATGRKNPVCSYHSDALEISPLIYQPGYNTYSGQGGGSLQIKLRGDDKHLILSYGYKNSYSSTLDNYSFKIYPIDHRNKKLPDYQVNGYFLFGDFSEQNTQPSSVRMTRYTGVSINDHKQIPKLTLNSNLAWDESAKKQIQQELKVLWSETYSFLTFPEKIHYELISSNEQLLKQLGKLYTAVAQTQFNSKQFNKAFNDMRQFFLEHGFKQLDPDNKDSRYIIWLTDYAHWLERTGHNREAIRVNEEIVRRAPDRAVNYLILARAQSSVKAPFADKEKEYYRQAVKDNYRQYCYRVLKEGGEIKPDTERIIRYTLGIESLSTQTCFPIMDLITAVRQNQIQKVQDFLSQGAEINALSNDGWPALAYAVHHNYLDMARLLLENGADATMVVNWGMDRTSGGNQGIFTLAYRKAVRQNKNKPRDFRVMDLLLKHGADVNAIDINATWPLLSIAIDAGDDIELAQYLLDRGAQANRVTRPPYYSPLIAALQKRKYPLVRLLIERGADVNLSAHTSAMSPSYTKTVWLYNWKSPLSFHLETLRMYYDYYKGSESLYPESIEILQLLLKSGADPTLGGPGSDENKPDQNGWIINEELAYKSASVEIKCMLDQYNPTGHPFVNKDGIPLCPR